jgi:hypothetical protein
MDLGLPLIKASIHESAHAVCALRFSMPLKEARIRHDGCGIVSYARPLSIADAECWVTTAMAGPICEAQFYGCCDDGGGDMMAIRAMMYRFGLDWNSSRFEAFAARARSLVERETPAIRAVASELLRHRRLSGDQIASMLPVESATSLLWVT